MCKHVAAVLYGIGARLDTKPELLFTLRGVDHEELIAADAEKAVAAATSRGKSKRLAADDLGAVFGIEIDAGNSEGTRATPLSSNGQSKAVAKKVRAKKTKSKIDEKVAKAGGKENAKIKKAAVGKTAKKVAAT